MSERTPKSRLARKPASLAVMLTLATLSPAAFAAPPSGSDTVQSLYDALLGTMKNARTLAQSGRFVQLQPVIRRSFDIPTMTRLSGRSFWPPLTTRQRHQATESFARSI